MELAYAEFGLCILPVTYAELTRNSPPGLEMQARVRPFGANRVVDAVERVATHANAAAPRTPIIIGDRSHERADGIERSTLEAEV